MYFIFGNYGNNTIALIQWAWEQNLENVYVLNVDTGWAAQSWQTRVQQGQQLAESYRFTAHTLQAKHNFSDLIRDRGSFPSQKFQWCAGFLKGLPFLEWADHLDPECAAIVLLGSRRADSRLREFLPEMMEQNEHFGLRTVQYPLANFSDPQRDSLIEKAGFKVLKHRSLECDPCIHANLTELKYLDKSAVKRVDSLEQELNQSMFQEPIQNMLCIKAVQQPADLENFDMGCGSNFACGE